MLMTPNRRTMLKAGAASLAAGHPYTRAPFAAAPGQQRLRAATA